MEDDLEKLNQEVDGFNGFDAISYAEKIRELWDRAKELRTSDPKRALRLITTVAFKSTFFPDHWEEEKTDAFRDALVLVDELGGRDFTWARLLAESCKSKGNYIGAAHHYMKAAKAYASDGVSFVKYTPPERNWSEQFSLLREATACFQAAGENEKASDAFIQSRHLQMQNKTGWAKRWMQVTWYVWGWGERPGRVVASGFALIALFAVLYFFVGINPPTDGFVDKVVNCFYFSTITFATVGYGDLQPANAVSKILAALEGLCGIFFTGLFLVTFVKRHSR